MFESINILAVFSVAILYMVIGSIWYAPFLFGKAWMKARNIKPEDVKKEDAMKAMGVSFLASILLAASLSHFITALNATTFADGAMTAFWLWLGFIATSHLIITMYEDRPIPLYTIFGAYSLIWMLISGGILAIWV